MKGVTVPEEFLAQGGTEYAPMSTTDDLKVAMQYSASSNAVLLRLRTENFLARGPDISYLSCFPTEQEYLFPCATESNADHHPLALTRPAHGVAGL